MNNKNLACLIVSVLLIGNNLHAQIEKLIETDTIYPAPESVAFDSLRNVIYASNYTAPTREGDYYGSHSITKANLSGEVLDTSMVYGLTSPTGICIYEDQLFIVDRFGVVVYDLKREHITDRFYVKTTDFLNDITIDQDGNIYVSVSGTNKIYRISNRQVEVWLDDVKIANPNGLLYHNGKLLVGSTDHSNISMIDLTTREISHLADFGEGIVDGIKACEGGYLVTIFEGKLFFVSNTGDVQELLNTTGDKIFQADFEYIPKLNLIVIPALWNNKLLIYHYSPE